MTFPHLLADIGGTNARFVLEIAPGQREFILVLKCAEYATLSDAIRAYLTHPEAILSGAGKVKRAGIAIANPVHSDTIKMTNHDWTFSIREVKKEFAFKTFLVMNDFKALAMSLPFLTPAQRHQLGSGVPDPHAVIGLLGAGTGLGTCGLIPAGKNWVALDSEGGHASFSPTNPLEIGLLEFALQTHKHVSSERFLSGAGIKLIYDALTARGQTNVDDIDTPEIIRRGLADTCALCRETLNAFCEMMGTMAGNLAITLGTTGGVYLGGGIIPRLGQFFNDSNFRLRFEQKGRLTNYLSQIPTYVITEPYPAFIGISTLLRQVN